jgi:hypothetical protein
MEEVSLCQSNLPGDSATLPFSHLIVVTVVHCVFPIHCFLSEQTATAYNNYIC